MLCKLDANLVKIFQITSGFSDNFTEIDKNQLKTKEKALQKTNLKQGFSKKEEVVPPGIEPGTHGFSVRCSTN